MGTAFRWYRNLVIWGPFVPLDRAAVATVEVALGTTLPDAYVRLLEAVHGGRMLYSVALPPGPGAELICFDRWFRFDHSLGGLYTAGSVLGEWQLHCDSASATGLPRDALPIAVDGGGSLLLLRTSRDLYGEVYACLHGLGGWTGVDGRAWHGPVAPDLDSYLDMLVIDDELAERVWTDRDPDDEDTIVRWLDTGLVGWRDRYWT